MTDEQRKRIHKITYSCDDRAELAERIVALEDENKKLRELVREAVDAASLKDMRDWRYGKRLAFLREARELGIEADDGED